jgi:hypothetical protein
MCLGIAGTVLFVFNEMRDAYRRSVSHLRKAIALNFAKGERVTRREILRLVRSLRTPILIGSSLLAPELFLGSSFFCRVVGIDSDSFQLFAGMLDWQVLPGRHTPNIGFQDCALPFSRSLTPPSLSGC